MRRILLVLAVAALMAAMMVTSAVPAFAAFRCDVYGATELCRGGSGSGGSLDGGGAGSGGGFLQRTDLETGEEITSGGRGGGGGLGGVGGSGGGVGFHCTENPLSQPDCSGTGFGGQP